MRVVRDIFSAHFERAIVDDEQQFKRLVSFFTRTAPELVERVELWEQKEPLFEAYGVDKAIDGVLSRRVDLPSGGYLVIDYAEALTVIDVNSGSFIGRGKGAALEDTITKTNLEAAEEVVNQLRLRDIGGIIVIDFIDMARARNRDAVMKTLQKDPRRGPHEDIHGGDLEAGPGRDDPPERDRGGARDHEPAVPDVRGGGRDPLGGDDRDRVRAPAARRSPRKSGGGGVPRADQPAGDRRVHRPWLARVARAGGRRRASRSSSRAPKGLRSSTSRSPSRAPVRRSKSVRCRSARAMRCSSRSSSRTCMTWTTRSRRSTATSSRSRVRRAHVGEKRMVRIDQVGRTAASALLLDESGEVLQRRRARRAARRAAGRNVAAASPERDSQVDAALAPPSGGCRERRRRARQEAAPAESHRAGIDARARGGAR